MRLSDFDLEQLDSDRLSVLSLEEKDTLLPKLIDDLKEARDRLNQNSQNSSRPPSSKPPWETGKRSSFSDEEEDQDGIDEDEQSDGDGNDPSNDTESSPTDKDREGEAYSTIGVPGRKPGMKGHGRKVELAVTSEEMYLPTKCCVCDCELNPDLFVAWTAFYVLDLVVKAVGLAGLEVRHVKHTYGEIVCSCGHVNRSEPGIASSDAGWKIKLSEWHLVGPTLASMIVCLHLCQRSSRRGIQRFFNEWFNIYLSTSTISRCIHEAGRAVAPLEDQLACEVREAALVYADETSWKESGLPLWLWVFSSPTVTLYLIGYRCKEIIQTLLGDQFSGWLMSDGYTVYRDFNKRLRCWAHLIRKARGLQESLDGKHAKPFGREVLAFMNELTQAIRQAREGPPVDLALQYVDQLAQFKRLCEANRDSAHKKTRELAREFLNDWDAIWIILNHPWLPLTNNEAERALRHWVILRRICQGTRTPQGTRAFGLLASVIMTCRKRDIVPWPYLAQVIAQRRKGNPAPLLPVTTTS